jgi:S-adenosylmethionine synthetase
MNGEDIEVSLSFLVYARKDIFMPNTTNDATLFTSESVCAGHPDKICDAISDAVVDAALAQDPHSRTGIETVAGANRIALFGEIKTTADINFEKIVRQKVAELGYTEPAWGFSVESEFSNDVHQQSPEIAQGVDRADEVGAGDQGMMFGYACDETPELMPLPIALAHALTRRIDDARTGGELKWLRPDGKAQVTVRYEGGKPVSIEKVVAAVAHDEQTTAEQVRADLIRTVIEPIITQYGFELPDDADVIINGTGLWHIPGPESDAGLTGRKIVVDTYGGYARVGGGAFSGKDPSKVDRSGAYAARYIAKNIVAAGLATKCEVGLAYVIGQPLPLMQTIDTFGTATVSEEELYAFKDKLIDTSVKGIIDTLDLARPIYGQTSAYGHFGKPDLPWEKIVS